MGDQIKAGEIKQYYRIPAGNIGSWVEQFEWCCKTFGSPSTNAENPKWFEKQCNWVSINGDFIFSDESSVSMYLLKWGGGN